LTTGNRTALFLFLAFFLPSALFAQAALSFVAERDTTAFNWAGNEFVLIHPGDIITGAEVDYGLIHRYAEEFHLLIKFGDPNNRFSAFAEDFRQIHAEYVSGENIVQQEIIPGFRASHRTLVANLRLRESPSTAAPIIATLDLGTEVELLQIGPQAVIGVAIAPWVRVMSATGYTGWCFSGYLDPILPWLTEARPTPLAPGIVPGVLNPANVPEIVVVEHSTTAATNTVIPPWMFIAAGATILTAAVIALIAGKRKR